MIETKIEGVYAVAEVTFSARENMGKHESSRRRGNTIKCQRIRMLPFSSHSHTQSFIKHKLI
jgi:hypothetical protein